MWLEKTAAEVRVICESCDKNFRLDALKFNIYFFFFLPVIPLIAFLWQYALFSVGLLAGIASGKILASQLRFRINDFSLELVQISDYSSSYLCVLQL